MEEMVLTEKRRLDLLEKQKTHAKYKSKRVALEQYRKTVKARLMKEALASGITSVQAQEREAYASEEFEEVIDGLELSTRIETELYWELKLFDVEVQVWRTMQANKRNDI